MSATDFTQLYLDKQICFPLYAASRLTIQFYEPFLKELNLTYPQYLVLLVLWENDQQTVNEIGNRLVLESNTLTPLLKRMAEKKLLTKGRSSTDERKVIISLTKEGKALKTKAVTIPEKIAQSLITEELSQEEVGQFISTLKKLVLVLDEKVK
jgi:MarR family transcriptional regulator, organic hydroperoxide resistance regulator